MNHPTGNPMKTKTLPDGLTKLHPDIRLHGVIDKDTFDSFHSQMTQADKSCGPLLLELTTTGGDADVARRIAHDIRLLREYEGIDLVFLGKTAVYSAGVTIMSALLPSKRFLTATPCC